MGFFGTLGIAASGMTAHRLWMDTISSNIANANTTKTADGTPFRRELVIFRERAGSRGEGGGVEVSGLTQDPSELRRVYEPSHPDADEEGYVSYPNVNVVMEMVDLIAASRAYEANVSAFESAKSAYLKTLSLLQF
jgi:flagellar basal-body rod protein FlgC